MNDIQYLIDKVIEAREGVEIVKRSLESARLDLGIAEFNLKETMKRQGVKTISGDDGRVSITRRTTKKLKNEGKAIERLQKHKVPQGEYTSINFLKSKIIKKLEELGEDDLIEKEVKEGVTITKWEQVTTEDNLSKLK